MFRVIFLLLISASAFAQKQSAIDEKVPVYFSPGYRERAATLQQLIYDVEIFYEAKYPQYKFSIKLNILDRNDWDKLPYKMPYGLPHYRDAIVIGADKMALFKDSSDASVVSAYDGIAVHELGHYFMSALVKTDIWPNWANEFIATYFQTIYGEGKIPLIIPDSSYKPTHRSLEDFEKGFSYIGGDDYGWYQKQFLVLAQRLYLKHKFTILDTFINNYKPGGKQAQAIELLQSIDPAIMKDWLTEMK